MTLIEEMMVSFSSNFTGLIWTLGLIINTGNNLLILHQKVFGYEAVDATFTENGWGGLEYNGN